jgi:hypothetical protein
MPVIKRKLNTLVPGVNQVILHGGSQTDSKLQTPLVGRSALYLMPFLD